MRGGGKSTTDKEKYNHLKETDEDLLNVPRLKNKEIHDDDIENATNVTESLLVIRMIKHAKFIHAMKTCGTHLLARKT